jgi:hypothetical protein
VVQAIDYEGTRREARRIKAEGERLAAARLREGRHQREATRTQQAQQQAATRAAAGAAGVEGSGVALAQQFGIDESIREEQQILVAAQTDAQTIRNRARDQRKNLKKAYRMNLITLGVGLAGGLAAGVIGGLVSMGVAQGALSARYGGSSAKGGVGAKPTAFPESTIRAIKATPTLQDAPYPGGLLG